MKPAVDRATSAAALVRDESALYPAARILMAAKEQEAIRQHHAAVATGPG